MDLAGIQVGTAHEDKQSSFHVIFNPGVSGLDLKL